MKIIHTADWHLGQMFFNYERHEEHQKFLDWLIQIIKEKQIELLLISGDIFDTPNPSAKSQKIYYAFFKKLQKERPEIQTIIIAGNHDSAGRLESPQPLLENFNTYIKGYVEKEADQKIDYKQFIIPIETEKETVWCIALPYLRQGDYPKIEGSTNPYQSGINEMLNEIIKIINDKKKSEEAIICLAHLNVSGAELSDSDKQYAELIGGLDAISANSFTKEITYTALGHIHKAQRLAGKENIRYSGSPIPLSFSEINYKHQVIYFETNQNKIENLECIPIPITIPLLRIPTQPQPPEEVITELKEKLKDKGTDKENNTAPFLEVRVLLKEAVTGLRHKIEEAIEGKLVNLARITISYPTGNTKDKNDILLSFDEFQKMKPIDILEKYYRTRHNAPLPETLRLHFEEILKEVERKENQA